MFCEGKGAIAHPTLFSLPRLRKSTGWGLNPSAHPEFLAFLHKESQRCPCLNEVWGAAILYHCRSGYRRNVANTTPYFLLL